MHYHGTPPPFQKALSRLPNGNFAVTCTILNWKSLKVTIVHAHPSPFQNGAYPLTTWYFCSEMYNFTLRMVNGAHSYQYLPRVLCVVNAYLGYHSICTTSSPQKGAYPLTTCYFCSKMYNFTLKKVNGAHSYLYLPRLLSLVSVYLAHHSPCTTSSPSKMALTCLPHDTFAVKCTILHWKW